MNMQKMMPGTSKDGEPKDGDGRALVKAIDRPTFILKTREGESRAVSPSQRNGNKKEPESSSNVPPKLPDPIRPILPSCLEMTSSIRLMDENMDLCESALEYLQDQQDFLVIGTLGCQGVGKSTIMSLLASNHEPDVFPVQDISHHENGMNCTIGVDFFVTKNRVIYLDTQPILSVAVTQRPTYEPKMNHLVTLDEDIELKSLRLAAFLFSICHVVIVVQDWFGDPNITRFLQTAEMFKPCAFANVDQEYFEFYPHVVFLHNKVEPQDYTTRHFKTITDYYTAAFANSKLQTHSSLDMRRDPMEGGINLFLVPTIGSKDELKVRQNEEKILEDLKIKIYGATRNPMTPSPLTEKNWYHYVSKVADVIKKSHLPLEYARLMP